MNKQDFDNTQNHADHKIFLLFREYGAKALLYRQKCIGLLPEIYRRKIHERQGFQSIFEFAAKYAGISQEQVKRVLSLEEKFQDKPALHQALITGEISINKLARVASIATVENQDILVEQTRMLSKSALETLAKDIRNSAENNCDEIPEFVPGHKIFGTVESTADLVRMMAEKSLKLAPEVTAKLKELKGKGIDINEIILDALNRREGEIARKKERIAAEVGAKPQQQAARYIPVKIKRVLQMEHGDLCSIPGCGKQSGAVHHTQRFALGGRHDPRFMAPLCIAHHQIAHAIDIKVQNERNRYINKS